VHDHLLPVADKSIIRYNLGRLNNSEGKEKGKKNTDNFNRMTKAWEKHKVLLHRLYILEKQKLKRVMEFMKKTHEFDAWYVNCFPFTAHPHRLNANHQNTAGEHT